MMKLKYLIFTACTLLFPFSAYGAPVASASDAQAENDLENMEYLQDLLEENSDLSDSETLQEILAYVQMINDNITGPGVASSSDADRDEGLPLPTDENLEYPADGVESQVELFSLEDDVDLFAAGDDQYVNVLRYDITFHGDDYILLIPPEYIDSLYIDADGYLWNMSVSTITGRAVDADFDPLQEEGYLFYLTPCLGNNFSMIREYGSPNYMRHYYWTSSSYGSDRLTYDTTYGPILVNDWSYPFYQSETLTYIIVFLIGGGVLLLWLRNYKNY